MVLLIGLTKLGYLRNLASRYRFDEGPVHSFRSHATGKQGTRGIVLRKLDMPPNTVLEDPAGEIVTAKRLRFEVSLDNKSTVFLDFNVTGADDAINALSCK